ncbi:hypothetical protein ABV409_07080 [Flagellimonas sp. DF-77]|uniref:hypothetical protein n=1 Tax=Flagellimonas algarum TaxID=3230298 RepID=UPI00339345F0
MKIKKYISTLFLAALLIPLFSAKEDTDAIETTEDLTAVVFTEETLELDFDTADFLPEGFDPYANEVPLESIQFIEEDEVELGFDTAKYLPEGFDPYRG